MIYGYARVSSKEQKLDRQIIDLIKFGVDEENIYKDKESGKNFSRTNYQKLGKKLKENDLFVIKSIDRLGRNYDMIIEEWSFLTKNIKCDIVVIDMNLLDTRTDKKNLIGKFISDIVLQILSFVAENERTNTKKKQTEGIRIAKAKGILFGIPKIEITQEIINVFNSYKNKKCSFKEALELSSLSHGTFYKYYRIFLNHS